LDWEETVEEEEEEEDVVVLLLLLLWDIEVLLQSRIEFSWKGQTALVVVLAAQLRHAISITSGTASCTISHCSQYTNSGGLPSVSLESSVNCVVESADSDMEDSPSVLQFCFALSSLAESSDELLFYNNNNISSR
jgi:hypothetical protein